MIEPIVFPGDGEMRQRVSVGFFSTVEINALGASQKVSSVGAIKNRYKGLWLSFKIHHIIADVEIHHDKIRLESRNKFFCNFKILCWVSSNHTRIINQIT